MEENVRSYNVGSSDYSKHKIQPWTIWIEYGLNPFDADIVKRILRRKEEKGMTRRESRKLDYEKIIHICKERLRQLEENTDPWNEFFDTIQEPEFEDESEGFLTPGKEYRCKKSFRKFNGNEHLTVGALYKAIEGDVISDNYGNMSISSKEFFEEHFEH